MLAMPISKRVDFLVGAIIFAVSCVDKRAIVWNVRHRNPNRYSKAVKLCR